VRGNSRALSDAPSWREVLKEILEGPEFGESISVAVTILFSTKTSRVIERVYYLRGVSACDKDFCFTLLRRRADT
jgi:hypothetical protein